MWFSTSAALVLFLSDLEPNEEETSTTVDLLN